MKSPTATAYTILLVAVLGGSLSLSGCQLTMTKEPSVNNALTYATLFTVPTKWASTHYEERCTINTEPADCRIYCENRFIGISPLTTTLDGGVFERWSAPGEHKWYIEGRKRDKATWRIAAFKDGYQDATYTISVGEGAGDPIFDKAFENYMDNPRYSRPTPPETITVERAILLSLRPVGTSTISGSSIPSNQSSTSNPVNSSCTGQPPYSITNPHPDPQTEYNLAVEAYRAALKDVDDVRAMGEVGGALATAFSPQRNPALFATGAYAHDMTHLMILPDAKQTLRFAEMRLRNAEERLRQSRGGQ